MTTNQKQSIVGLACMFISLLSGSPMAIAATAITALVVSYPYKND